MVIIFIYKIGSVTVYILMPIFGVCDEKDEKEVKSLAIT